MLELKKLAAGVACATMALALSLAGAAAAAESLSPAIPGVSAASLVAPMPDQGPVAGGTDVTVTAPRGVTFTQVAAGGFHSLALANDGKIYAWGSNDYGQLGDGTITEQHESVQVQGPAGVKFTQIAGGLYYSVALGDDGNTYAWGENNYGQLGDGTNTDRHEPVRVQVPPGVTFTQIAAGNHHSLALGNDGNVYAWGANNDSELGDGTTVDRNVPVLVQVPVGVAFTQVASGGQHSLALGDDGNAYAWGRNYDGELGNGTTTNQAVPVLVQVPVGVTFTQISGGTLQSTALGDDGNTYSWGANFAGQLGDGTNIGRDRPVLVQVPAAVLFTQLEGGQFFSLALGDDGNTYAWGDNSLGQLGDGTRTNQNVPVQVQSPGGVAFTQITAGDGDHTLALGDDGNVYAWGANFSGQLGDGTVTGRDVPVPVVFPGVVVVTEVLFGGVAGTNLRDNGDGNYTVTTPAHASCAVDVSLAWTLDGVVQAPVVYPGGFTYLGVPAVTDPTAQSVVEGGSAAFTSSAAGCPVASLVWEVSTDGGATWGSVSVLAQAVVSADGTSLSIDATPFVFDGYLFRSVATNTEGATVSAAAALTVSAAITVSLNANGGTGTMADLVGAAGAAVTLPTSTFTRPGYVVAGWNTAVNGSGTAYADGATFTFPDAAVTLYAQWTLQPSASVSPSSQAPNALPKTGSNIAGPIAGVGVLIAAGLGLLVVRFSRRKAGVRVTN